VFIHSIAGEWRREANNTYTDLYNVQLISPPRKGNVREKKNGNKLSHEKKKKVLGQSTNK
jgi:hypothetical protein